MSGPPAIAAPEARLAERFHGLVGASPEMVAVFHVLRGVAASRASVFVTGEPGTGKRLVAEALHAAGPRAGRRLVAVQCAGQPADMLEGELFGHLRGAYPGAGAERVGAAKLADGGTLFLDDVGALGPSTQARLLRFAQSGSFTPLGATRVERADVRLVCADTTTLLPEVAAGRFREDLYYRLCVVPIELPPLRRRGADALAIARHLLWSISARERRKFRGFTREAEAAVLAYDWPGNAHELKAVITDIVAAHRHREWVEAEMLPEPVRRAVNVSGVAPVPPGPVAPAAPEVAPFADAPVAPPAIRGEPEPEIVPLAVMERRLILAALRRTGHDVPRAAALLEINPSTVYRKLSAWRAAGLGEDD